MKHNPPRDHVRNSFAIVREPCDRLVSEFAWAKNQAWFDVYYKEYRVAKAFPPTCATWREPSHVVVFSFAKCDLFTLNSTSDVRPYNFFKNNY